MSSIFSTNIKLKNKMFLQEQFKYLKTTHSYHLVDPSPWQIIFESAGVKEPEIKSRPGKKEYSTYSLSAGSRFSGITSNICFMIRRKHNLNITRFISNLFLLICDAPDLWELRCQDPASTNFFIIHFVIFLVLVFLLVLLLEDKILTNFSKNNKLLLLIIVALIALFFQLYILSIYVFAGTIFLHIGLEKWQFNKQKLKLENHIIDSELLPDMFEVKYYHIIFMIFSLIFVFFFNVPFGAFYMLFIVLGFLGALFKLNIYNVIPKKLYLYFKDCRKDLNTIQYHWSTNFFFFKIWNRLTLVSLPLGIFVLAFVLPIHQKNDPILLLNFCEIGIIFFITAFVSFLIDIYIILFGNSSVFNKFGFFCYRCAAYGALSVLAGTVLEKQFLHNSFDRLNIQWQPTFFTNVPRILMGKPIVTDYDQYHQYNIIKKYLPHISEEQFTTKREYIVSQIDSTKANEVIKGNWKTISENATHQELSRIRLGEGYLSSNVTRK